DANQRPVEERNNGGDDFLPAQLRQREITSNSPPQTGQSLTELAELIELHTARVKLPARVIEILFTPPRIAAGSLDMASVARANPDVRPGRRNDELLDTLQPP